ncbi:hypothetical protein J6TS7_29590 [Paenibacillus dendritiformis]|uniref:aspartyl-phosphate phosphatase Spo0E family protein n=1 Tax=Paenibacillus TaxID=44249 RepID=UPI001B190D57|nr:aspartyl-phosphate phosphatase Spo0E family protein [Paenibacillus dendritiformis]GIO79349.1 hypothetical protein J6TS7_29590 [Paenibacillus dendritiformis]
MKSLEEELAFLEKKMEAERAELNRLQASFHNLHSEMLELSQKLDETIIRYMKLQTKLKKPSA